MRMYSVVSAAFFKTSVARSNHARAPTVTLHRAHHLKVQTNTLTIMGGHTPELHLIPAAATTN